MSHPPQHDPPTAPEAPAVATAQPPAKIPLWKRRRVVGIGGFLAGVIVAGAGSNTTTTNASAPTVTTTATVRATTTETLAADTVEPAVETTVTETVTAEPTTAPAGSTIPGAGTFEVGADVKPGRYKSARPDDGDSCYWARLKDTDGGIIANNLTQGPSVVVIKKTDAFFETNGCQEFVKVG